VHGPQRGWATPAAGPRKRAGQGTAGCPGATGYLTEFFLRRDAWSKAQQGSPESSSTRPSGSSAEREEYRKFRERHRFPASPVDRWRRFPADLQNENFARGQGFLRDGLNPSDEVAVVLGPVDRPFKVAKILFLFGGSSGKGTVTLKISQTLAARPPVRSFHRKLRGPGADTALQEVDLHRWWGCYRAGEASACPSGAACRTPASIRHECKRKPRTELDHRSGVWSDIKPRDPWKWDHPGDVSP